MHMEEELNVSLAKNQKDTQHDVQIFRSTGTEKSVKLSVLIRKNKKIFI